MDDSISSTATTDGVARIVGPPANVTVTLADPRPASYVVSAHPPTPRPAQRDERVSLAGVDPMNAVRAMLRTPPVKD